MLQILLAILLFIFFFLVLMWLMNLPAFKKEMFQRKVIRRATHGYRHNKQNTVVNKNIMSNISMIDKTLGHVSAVKCLATKMHMADIGLNVFVIFLSSCVSYAVTYLILRYCNISVSYSTLMSLCAAAIPLLCVYFKIQIRKKKFEANFVEGLTIIKNAIKSGLGLTSALRIVGEDASWPVNVEFKRLLNEVEFGFALNDALERLEKRIQLDELSFFVSTLKIQSKAGGNLSQIIENIEDTIRTRFQLKREVQTLSAQGKMSGIILISMPIVLVCVLSLMNPGFLDPLIQHDTGRQILGLSVAGLFVGMYWIYRIVNIDL